MTKTLLKLREEIDALDQTIAQAYATRMNLVKEVGEAKALSNTAVLQENREAEVIKNVVRASGEKNRHAVSFLYRDIMDYSKAEQLLSSAKAEKFYTDVLQLERRAGYKTESPSVACQGVEGAYSHIAASELFSNPKISFHKSFKDVFSAVAKGDVKYGVLPIENSTAGSVDEVYDLLLEYRLKIVAAKKVKVSHCMLGVDGAILSQITRVFSHSQALCQCRKTLDILQVEERRELSNTAVAAKTVAESGDKTSAAIASELTAKLYGLTVLKRDTQDAQENYTRFIVVSNEGFVVKGGNKISMVVSIEHKEGALHRLLGIFAAANKNLMKLESRPIPEKQFEFLFYLDLEGELDDTETLDMLKRVGAYAKSAVFLGAYSEGK